MKNTETSKNTDKQTINQLKTRLKKLRLKFLKGEYF